MFKRTEETADIDTRNYRMLVVEDDEASRALLAATARRGGYDFHALQSGAGLLEAVESYDPDVVILDVDLPGRNGFELCALLKSGEETRQLPVVMLTSITERQAMMQAMRLGCADFLTKPFDAAELLLRLQKHCRQKRAFETLDRVEGMLESLALTVEARDQATGRHCERLREAGRLFGTYLGLRPSDVHALEQGGVLHDIGKLAIPDSILLKPGKLTAEEWAIMQTHTTEGAQILEPLRTMRKVVPIVRSHHERWDGAGYPDGLMGDEIPLLARVFQILDAYDALRSSRPYKRAFCRERAEEILRTEASAGKWDPKLISEFLRWLDIEGSKVWP